MWCVVVVVVVCVCRQCMRVCVCVCVCARARACVRVGPFRLAAKIFSYLYAKAIFLDPLHFDVFTVSYGGEHENIKTTGYHMHADTHSHKQACPHACHIHTHSRTRATYTHARTQSNLSNPVAVDRAVGREETRKGQEMFGMVLHVFQSRAYTARLMQEKAR